MAKRTKKKDSSSKAARVTSEPSTTSAAEVTAFQSKFAPVSWTIVLQALLIILAGLWIYWPALQGDWLWDDDTYITQNTLLHNPARFWEIWFAPGSSINYFPVTFTVQWLQWRLWHIDPLGYHVTNLVLHLFSALLVWKLFSKLGLRLAWLGGLLFTIHPVQVESVAWISEIKNTLSLPLLLLAMIFYIDYEEHRVNRDYFLAMGFFLVTLLCKTTSVMFPVVILLYVWWRRGRIGWNDLKASIPFFLLSLAMGILTVWAQSLFYRSHGEPNFMLGGFFSRLDGAGWVIFFYLAKCFWPLGLLPIYPQWTRDPSSIGQWLPWPMLIGAAHYLWTKRREWGRHALLGLGFFLVNLIPFLGFLPSGYMDFTWVMDHFLYLPIIGLIGLAIAAMEQVEERLPLNALRIGMGIMSIILVLLAYESHGYVKKFVNSETLWTYTLQRNPQAWPAHNNLSRILLKTGQIQEAIDHSTQALKLAPNNYIAHNNLGIAFFQKGEADEAIVQFQKALAINRYSSLAQYNLGGALFKRGQINEGLAQLQKAIEIDPDYVEAHSSLGIAFFQIGETDKAMTQFQMALEINPDYAEAHYGLGNIFTQKGQMNDAIVQFQKALEINPDYAEAHLNLGIAFFQMGEVDEAMTQFQKVLEIDPTNVQATNDLGVAFSKKGQVDAAIAQYQKALRLKPDFKDAQNNLARAISEKSATKK